MTGNTMSQHDTWKNHSNRTPGAFWGDTRPWLATNDDDQKRVTNQNNSAAERAGDDEQRSVG